jgi:Phosphodiester glycosidase
MYSHIIVALFCCITAQAQVRWQNVTERFGPLPKGIQVYYSNDSLEGKPFIGYYVQADLKDKELRFTAQTGQGKRYRPSEYYNQEGSPLVVVNCTFFNFDKNQNLNLVVRNGKMVAYNIPFVKGRGRDSTKLIKTFRSALGINKKRQADVAWIYADTGMRRPMAAQQPVDPIASDSLGKLKTAGFKKWKMKTAVGGGPVLVQNGAVMVTNNEEMLFGGKGIADKHPRTAMGYTQDGKLIIMAIQGRFPGVAEGASLPQEAQLLVQLGCVEALNLDGGGSSCLLVNGKETIHPSDKEGQRPVPAVFLVNR